MTEMALKKSSLLLLIIGLGLSQAFAQLTIGAAADLQMVMPSLIARFEAQTGSTVSVSYGASGNLFTQIQNGAPYDVFFSADEQYPRKLQQAGLTSDAPYEYAIGKIVLWALNSASVDVHKGLIVTADPVVRKVAIANPAHAPYGRAAEAALRNSGLWDKVSPKLVLGENISQTAQFVESGNADLGIVALSLALSPAMQKDGSYVEISQNLYSPVHQAVVILKASSHLQLAERFIDFLKTSEAKSLLARDGFSTEAVKP
jgi:molybdate transport system substrate-binding protein